MAQLAMEQPASGGRSRLLVIGAVVFAAITAVLFVVALQSRGGEGGGSVAATADVVVASRDIGANTIIEADMVRMEAVAVDQLLTGAYSATDVVVGLPVRYPLQQGEQVTSAKVGLSAIADEKDLALVLEPGMRAFAVVATEITAVGGLLLPGNVVDVIAVYQDDEQRAYRAVTILQGIEVLGVAQEAQEPVPATTLDGTSGDEEAAAGGIRGQRPDEVERQPNARSVTLAVTPEQAQILAGLQSQNQNVAALWLSLRPLDDDDIRDLRDTDFVPFQFLPPLP